MQTAWGFGPPAARAQKRFLSVAFQTHPPKSKSAAGDRELVETRLRLGPVARLRRQDPRRDLRGGARAGRHAAQEEVGRVRHESGVSCVENFKTLKCKSVCLDVHSRSLEAPPARARDASRESSKDARSRRRVRRHTLERERESATKERRLRGILLTRETTTTIEITRERESVSFNETRDSPSRGSYPNRKSETRAKCTKRRRHVDQGDQRRLPARRQRPTTWVFFTKDLGRFPVRFGHHRESHQEPLDTIASRLGHRSFYTLDLHHKFPKRTVERVVETAGWCGSSTGDTF